MDKLTLLKFYINKFSYDLEISKAEAYRQLIQLDCFNGLVCHPSVKRNS